MRVIGQRVHPLGTTLGDVVFVGGNGHLIGSAGIRVASEPAEDVRRHMHQVPGSGRERQKPFGGDFGQFGSSDFNGVDVKVNGSGVVWVRVPSRISDAHDQLESSDTARAVRIQ